MTKEIAITLTALLMLISLGFLIGVILFNFNNQVIYYPETENSNLGSNLRLIEQPLNNLNDTIDYQNGVYKENLSLLNQKLDYETEEDFTDTGGGRKILETGCKVNSDCGDDFSKDFCQNNDVYRNFYDYTCRRGKCDRDVDKKLVEKCEFGCDNGQCIIKPECSDKKDNDNDNLIDAQDPGCWDELSNPATYNPNLDNESRGSVVCFSKTDCGSDGLTGNTFCNGPNNEDVYQNFRTFICNSPGTGVSSCSETSETKLIETCRTKETCFLGTCIDIECDTDLDCDDNNIYTEDKCFNSGSFSSFCFHNKIKCISDSDCDDNNIYTEDTCENPGTTESSCSYENIKCFSKTDCGTDGLIGNTFCKEDTSKIFQKFEEWSCENSGTTESLCTNVITDSLVDNCGLEETCFNGDCLPVACNESFDCGFDDFVGNTFCRDGDVYQNFKSFTCNNPRTVLSSCSSDVNERLVDDCDLGCNNGECITEICDNGIDDDFDGLIDGLTELAPLNGETLKIGNTGGNGPWVIVGFVNQRIRDFNLPFSQITRDVILRSVGDWRNGTDVPHMPTLNKICEIAGFSSVKSSECFASGSGSNCNYYSPGDNYLWRFVNGNFRIETAAPKYGKSWLSEITCEHRLSVCNDKIDNDNDGKIDMNDNGCASVNDDSEIPHDNDCVRI